MLKNTARRTAVQAYLSSRDYGNQTEAAKYMSLLDGAEK